MTFSRSDFMISAVALATSMLAGCAAEPEYQHAFDHSRQLHRNTHIVNTTPDRARQVVIATFIRDGFTINESAGDVISATRLLLDPDDSDLSYQVLASAVVSPQGEDQSFIALSANQKTIRHKDTHSVERQQGTIDDAELYQSFFADVDDYLARLPKSPSNPLARTRNSPAAASAAPATTPEPASTTARSAKPLSSPAPAEATAAVDNAAAKAQPLADAATSRISDVARPAAPIANSTSPLASITPPAAPAAPIPNTVVPPTLLAAPATSGNSLLGSLVNGGASAVSAGAGLVQSAASVASSAVQAAPAAAQAYQGANLAVPAAAASGIAAVLAKSGGLLMGGATDAGAAAQQAKELADRENKKDEKKQDEAAPAAAVAPIEMPVEMPLETATEASATTAVGDSAAILQTTADAAPLADATSATAKDANTAAEPLPAPQPAIQPAEVVKTTSAAADAATGDAAKSASTAVTAPTAATATSSNPNIATTNTTVVVKDSSSLLEKAGESIAGMGLQSGLKNAVSRYKDRLPALLGGTADKPKDENPQAAAAP